MTKSELTAKISGSVAISSGAASWTSWVAENHQLITTLFGAIGAAGVIVSLWFQWERRKRERQLHDLNVAVAELKLNGETKSNS